MSDLKVDRNTLLLVIACFLLGMIVMSLVVLIPPHHQKQVIVTDKAPRPIGPYSQAIHSDNLVYTSGQIGIDPETGNLSSTIEGQTDQVMRNLQEILRESGLDFSDVVVTRIYLTNLSDFSTVNTIYAHYIGNSSPARSTIQVAGLPRGAMVEIEMTAQD
ncbi:MAG: RidA family protein [Methanomicrobiales archaeon]